MFIHHPARHFLQELSIHHPRDPLGIPLWIVFDNVSPDQIPRQVMNDTQDLARTQSPGSY